MLNVILCTILLSQVHASPVKQHSSVGQLVTARHMRWSQQNPGGHYNNWRWDNGRWTSFNPPGYYNHYRYPYNYQIPMYPYVQPLELPAPVIPLPGVIPPIDIDKNLELPNKRMPPVTRDN